MKKNKPKGLFLVSLSNICPYSRAIAPDRKNKEKQNKYLTFNCETFII